MMNGKWLYLPTVLFALVLGACGSSEPVVEIALHPTKPNILYIATNAYLYKSRDEGATWQNMSQGMTHSRVISLAIDPLFPANVYAGTKGDAVFRSYNGGQNWESKRAGLEDVTISSVVHQLVFVPGSSQRFFAATSMGVFESETAGETWIKRMDGMKEVLMVISLAIDSQQPQTLYAGTSGGVYKSLDGGRWWVKVNNGLVDPEVLKSSRALGVTKIQIDPHHSESVFAATLTGLYKTTNGGEAWEKIGEDLPDHMLSDLIVDPSIPGTIYVGSRKGVHLSTNGGLTWRAMNEGLENLNIRALAISPLDSTLLYVGTNGSGLYRSRHGGGSWEPVPLIVQEG
ncbi:WD40/YVTN/BNR-like repeat-containing protein [Candidatus Nitrospira salsa]